MASSDGAPRESTNYPRLILEFLIEFYRTRTACAAICRVLTGVGLAGLAGPNIVTILQILLQLVNRDVSLPSWLSLVWVQLASSAVMLIGISLGLNCVRADRASFLTVGKPESSYVGADTEEDRKGANPRLWFEFQVWLFAGARDVEILSVRILRYVQGLPCLHSASVIRVDSELMPMASNARSFRKPPTILAKRSAVLYIRQYFGPPLPEGYHVDWMEGKGEVCLEIEHRITGDKAARKPLVELYGHVAPNANGKLANVFVPIRNLASPPRLSNRAIRRALWCGWIERTEAKRIRQLSEVDRFRALRGFADHESQIDRMKSLNSTIFDRETELEYNVAREGLRFARVRCAVFTWLNEHIPIRP